MKKKVRAFTLIELLVVVLIIAILAAVALPQYQKAVLKSRLAECMIAVKAIGKAQEAYYLENGQYADSFGQLSLSVKCPPKGVCSITSARIGCSPVSNGRLGIGYRYLHQEEVPEYQGKLYCTATGDAAVKICKTYGDKLEDKVPGWAVYEIK